MRIRGFLPVLLLALLASPVFGQGRVITGTVVDSISGEPLEGARVSVRGTTLATLAGTNGRFTLGNAPSGELTLAIRRIGYRPYDVVLAAGDNEVRAALSRDLLQLSEVVVTGQATAVERRNLANAIATVSAEEISRVSAQSVEHALQGKVPGAKITTNSGAPGGGVQMQLRGVTSINAASEPLYVVDGVIMSNVAIPSNQNAVTNAAGGSNPALTQDAQVNRIADLNPNDIENIEILKGASASAIYGSKASNGVVIITTRRGTMGAPQFNLTQRIGTSRLSNTLGSRRYESVAEAVSVWGPAAATHFTPGVVFDQEKELAGEKPTLSETVLDVSGGSENTRYFVSGLWKDDGGIIDNTGFEKQSVRANLDHQLGSRLNLSVQTNVARSLAQRGLTNNDNAGVSFYMVFPFTPSFVNLRQREDGTFPAHPFQASNPLQTAALMTNDETVWRSIASGRLTYELVQMAEHSVRLIAIGGADFFSQENELLFPPELQFEPIDGEPGTSLLTNSSNLNLNIGGSAVYAFSPADWGLTATTSVGLMAASRDLETARIVSRNLVGGLGIVAAGTSIQVLEERERVEDFGLFAQEEVLLLDERLLLTAGVNADQSSANGDTDKLYVYPKFSGSYRFERPVIGIDELKVRAAYGESGNQPLFGQKFTPLTATQNINGLPGLIVQGTVGSPDLRPERQREIEGGIDLTVAEGRGTLEFTAFRKNITELLLERELAVSTGFALEIFNGGQLRTSGIEIGVGVVPIQTADLQWIFRTNFFSTKSKIVDLPVPTFRAGGFGTALGAFQIEEGASATQIVGNDSLPDGTRVVRKIGDATPDFTMSFSNDLSWRGFRLFGLLDWQQGGDIINLTKFLYDLGQNTSDFAEPITIGSLNTTKGALRLAAFGKQTAVFVEDGSFVKLRELTLSYEVPRDVVARLLRSGRTAQISLSGRNLATWTDYSGLDPEVSNFGNQPIARNIDVAPFPPSRSYWLSVSVGF